MNKLYTIKHAVATHETGPYNPQVQHIEPLLDSDAPNSIYRLYDSFYNFPAIDPKINYVTLKDGSEFTDMLSASMFTLTGFLVSQKLKELCLSFELPSYRIYPVPVKDGKSLVDYFWIHLLFKYKNRTFEEIQNENIDFSKSAFIIEKHLVKISDVQIFSVEELAHKRRELNVGTKVQASSLVLRHSFLNQMPDIFKVPLLGTHWIIKENFKEAILKASFTGIEIAEVKNIIID